MKQLRMWPCKDIDITWSDVIYAMWMCLVSSIERSGSCELELPTNAAVVPCMSVRAAFDLYLTVRRWGQGDECIFVGVNVPDMFQIAESHGLSVCGTDIDPITTQVNLSQIQTIINPRTRFIVIPHLFGHRLDLREVIELADAHDLEVIEDCAQAFSGSHWWGTQGATLSLFSFGPMKTATALQGAAAIVRDPVLSIEMKNEMDTFHTQPTWRYFLRIVRFGAMSMATPPLIYGSVIHVLKAFRVNHENLIHTSTKSLSNVATKRWLRARPCYALLRVIELRVKESNDGIKLRIEKGSIIHEAIGSAIDLVLRGRTPNNYWMIPILIDDPESFKKALRSEGFDVLSSRLGSVENANVPGASTYERMVMLAFSPTMPVEELLRQAQVLNERFGSKQ